MYISGSKTPVTTFQAPLGGTMFRYLWLLKLLVVVSFQFDQRAKYILVLISILVTQQYMLGLLIYSRFLQVFQGGSGIVLYENHKKTIKTNKVNTFTSPERAKGIQVDHTFQSSSNLLICWAVIWRALSCSCSDGIFTSQDRKHRSWISGCHCELSQLMSFRLLWLAQGCLNGGTKFRPSIGGFKLIELLLNHSTSYCKSMRPYRGLCLLSEPQALFQA